MQHFARVDKVRITAVVAGELRVADAEACRDAAERVAAADGHGAGGRWRVAAGGDAAAAVVGDDLTGIDHVKVAACTLHADSGHRPVREAMPLMVSPERTVTRVVLACVVCCGTTVVVPLSRRLTMAMTAA